MPYLHLHFNIWSCKVVLFGKIANLPIHSLVIELMMVSHINKKNPLKFRSYNSRTKKRCEKYVFQALLERLI